MKRLFLALLFALPTSAFAADITKATSNARGALWLDVRDFGAKPGTANYVTCAAAFQAAVDLPKPPGVLHKTVYAPSDPLGWWFDRPVWLDQPGVILVGDGIGQTSLNAMAYSFPPIIAGIKRVPSSLVGEQNVPDASHWVDLNGKLDNSVTGGTPNIRWGLRTKADALILFPSGGLSLGPRPSGWSTVKTFRLEMAVDMATTQLPVSGIFCGLWNLEKPSPWGVYYNSGYVILTLQTSDGVTRSFLVPSGVLTGVNRIAFQVDLVAGTALAWLNHNQVAVNLSQAGAGFAGGKLTLHDRDFSHFCLGFESTSLSASDMRGASTVIPPGASRSLGYSDVTMLGLKVSDGAAYRDLGAGKPQTRIDGAPVNDNAMFTDDPGTIDYVRNDVGPATYGNRMLRSARSFGLMLSPGHAWPGNTVVDCGIRDMSINTIGDFGHAVATGLAINWEATNIETGAGAYGMGDIPCGSNYTSTLTNCRLSGTEANLYKFFGIYTARDLRIGGAGRNAILSVCSSGKFDGGFVGNGVATEYVARMMAREGGGAYSFDGFHTDFETGDIPRKALFSFELDRYSPNSLFIRGGSHANIGPGAVMLELRSNQQPNDPAVMPGYVSMEGVRTFLNQMPGGYVRTDGKWRGAIRIDGERVPGAVFGTGP